MEKFKKYKWHILLPIVIFVVTVVVCAVMVVFSKQESVEKHMELGKKYLTEMNYSGAVLELKNAIAIDPNNEEARIQLAQAYYQSNDWEKSSQVLQEVISENSPNIKMSEELIQMYLKMENKVGALNIIQKLIEYTDDDKYYEMKDSIIVEMLDEAHSYAAGTDHELIIMNSKVMSRGSNVLGQLGTNLGLGDKTYLQANFRDAGFGKEPQKVYIVGRTSYVIDTAGNLWSAGENRWAQKGNGESTLLPESGWIQVVGGENVSKVVGITGLAYVLKNDGSLWYLGGENNQRLELVQNFSSVLDIEAKNSVLYVHTSKGELYTKDIRTDYSWSLANKNVRTFAISENGMFVWMNMEGNLGLPWYLSNVPEQWEVNSDNTYKTDMNISKIIHYDDNCFILTKDGNFFRLSMDGMLTEVEMESNAETVYCERELVIAELDNDNIYSFDNNSYVWNKIR